MLPSCRPFSIQMEYIALVVIISSIDGQLRPPEADGLRVWFRNAVVACPLRCHRRSSIIIWRYVAVNEDLVDYPK